MAVTECESCGGRVNEMLKACPHCGAKREVVARGKLTQEEVRALIATGSKPVDVTGNSLVASLLFPHPHTIGPARSIEIVLTILCAPLVLVGAAGVMMARWRPRSRGLIRAATTEGTAALVMTLFGGFSFYQLLAGFHVPGALPLTVASVMCLWVRAYIRGRTTVWKPADLSQLPASTTPRPSKPQLPAARALSRPVTAPAPVVPTAPPVAPPAAEPATAPGDEPRLLR
jgi:hypothetical protein